LIQLGGLGIMTAMTIVPLLVGQRIGLRQRFYFAKEKGLDYPSGAVKLLIHIIKVTMLFEAIGFGPLFLSFAREMPVGRAFFAAIFHSISAFCNAGFSLFSNNLEGYSNTFIVPGTIMFLIVFGGLGYPFYMELKSRVKTERKLTPYIKLVILATVSLILFGTLSLLLVEWNRSLAGFSPLLKIWNALFMSITPRTAGFDTIAPASLSKAGYVITILLMIIGASPSSTGGGIKTTTAGGPLVYSKIQPEGQTSLRLCAIHLDRSDRQRYDIGDAIPCDDLRKRNFPFHNRALFLRAAPFRSRVVAWYSGFVAWHYAAAF